MACSLSIMLARSRLSATGTACVPPLTSLCYPPLACFHGENSLSVCVVCVLFCSVGSKQAEPNQHNASNQSHWSGTDRVRLLLSAARTACTSLRRFLCWRVLMAHLLALFWLHVFHITWVSHHVLSAEWCASQAREQGDEQRGRREGKREGRRSDEREG